MYDVQSLRNENENDEFLVEIGLGGFMDLRVMDT